MTQGYEARAGEVQDAKVWEKCHGNSEPFFESIVYIYIDLQYDDLCIEIR